MKNQWKIDEKLIIDLGIDFSTILEAFGDHLGSLWGAFWGVWASEREIIIEQGVFLYLLIDVLGDLSSQEAILEQFGTVKAP